MARRHDDGHDDARVALSEKLKSLPCTLCGLPLARHAFNRSCLERRARRQPVEVDEDDDTAEVG